MAIVIDQPITGYSVDSDAPKIERMHEGLKRPEVLLGKTYKIKPSVSESAIYITINDMVLNADTKAESRHPREIFINCKDMRHFQWITALTRIVSAVWRKGGNAVFVIEEFKSVFDPNGGYFKKGGKFMPSLVAEIGHVIEQHLQSIGMIEAPKLDEHQAAYLASKRAEKDDAGWPETATLCSKCNTKAVIKMDGCDTCLCCGESKCS